MIRTALTALALCIASNAAHAQQFPLSDFSLHEWGGTASYTPNGHSTRTESRAYGPDAPAGGSIQPNPFPPGSGIAQSTVTSTAYEYTDADGSIPSILETHPLTGEPLSWSLGVNYMNISQSVRISRNTTTLGFSGDADGLSIYEWVVPALGCSDFGVAMGYYLSAFEQPQNGGVVDVTGSIVVTNVTTGEVLINFDGSTDSIAEGEIMLTQGDTLRFEMSGDISGTFPTGGGSFGRGFISATYECAVVEMPAPCDGDANRDGAVDVNDITYVLFRLGEPCD